MGGRKKRKYDCSSVHPMMTRYRKNTLQQIIVPSPGHDLTILDEIMISGNGIPCHQYPTMPVLPRMDMDQYDPTPRKKSRHGGGATPRKQMPRLYPYGVRVEDIIILPAPDSSTNPRPTQTQRKVAKEKQRSLDPKNPKPKAKASNRSKNNYFKPNPKPRPVSRSPPRDPKISRGHHESRPKERRQKSIPLNEITNSVEIAVEPSVPPGTNSAKDVPFKKRPLPPSFSESEEDISVSVPSVTPTSSDPITDTNNAEQQVRGPTQGPLQQVRLGDGTVQDYDWPKRPQQPDSDNVDRMTNAAPGQVVNHLRRSTSLCRAVGPVNNNANIPNQPNPPPRSHSADEFKRLSIKSDDLSSKYFECIEYLQLFKKKFNGILTQTEIANFVDNVSAKSTQWLNKQISN